MNSSIDLKNATLTRNDYKWFTPLTTRWMDNDIYGHINNAHYFSYFDTLTNTYLIKSCGLDIHRGEVIGYIVHSECYYKSPLVFPDELEGGLRVNRVGNSSVTYGLAIFKKGEDIASAHGSFTHVFVDRQTERPVAIDGKLREGLVHILYEEN